jgi:hypothetical protein
VKRRLACVFLVPFLLAFAWPEPAAAAPSGRTKASAVAVRARSQIRRPRAVGEQWARTDLFFGLSKPDGGEVSDQEFKQFLDTVVTPRFPDGLTLLTGFGQYRTQAGVIIQERSILIILLYPKRNNATDARIEEIRDEYKRAFQQESVLRVDTKGRVSF